MPTVTTYPNCPCCRPRSGSGGGGGTFLNCCTGITLPATIYATYQQGPSPLTCARWGKTQALNWDPVAREYFGRATFTTGCGSETRVMRLSLERSYVTGLPLAPDQEFSYESYTEANTCDAGCVDTHRKADVGCAITCHPWNASDAWPFDGGLVFWTE